MLATADRTRKPFEKGELHRVDAGLTRMDSTLAALADFNADKFTDAILLSGDQKRITVHLWNPGI